MLNNFFENKENVPRYFFKSKITLMCIISSGHPAIAPVSHDSRPFAKFLIACVNEPEIQITLY